MKSEISSCTICLCMTIALSFGVSTNSQAILANPDQTQTNAAIKRGMDFALHHRPPNELYWHFGSTKPFSPHGFMVTKTSGLAVMAAHYALRGETPTDQDIQRVLAEDALQVVVTVFGHSPGFARDSYLFMKQGQDMIKPERVRFDARARKERHDQETPVYRAKIVGLFLYGTLKPQAQTTLLVFPGDGGEILFELDLSAIP